MIKVWRIFITFILLIVLNSSFLPVKASMRVESVEHFTSVGQNTLPHNPIQLISSNQAGVSFEIQVPWQQIQSKLVTVDQAQYSQISIPDWPLLAQPGEPALPYTSQQIGVPFEAELTIKVSPGKSHTLTLSHPVLPAVTQSVIDITHDPAISETNQPNLTSSIKMLPAIYTGEEAYPGDFARVLEDAVLRHQRVANIAIFPVQYDPTTSEITVYESLTVEVTFDGLPQYSPSRLIEETGIYETLFSQNLLNYDKARHWRQSGELSPATISVSDASVAPGLSVYHAWSPPDPSWRIKVREDAFYKLTYMELLTAGLPVDDLDPRTFQMYNSGSEIAIDVFGEADGIFNNDDYLIFYGQAIDNKYTLDNVYWLTYGQQTGLRMTSRDGTPDSGQIPLSYLATQHYEQNHWYISRAAGDENLERFFWQSIYASSSLPKDWSYTFNLPSVFSGEAKLSVSMFGNLSTFINPDHHVKIYLNNILLDDIWWDGFAWQVPEIDLPDGLLVTGDNTLKVECPNDTGVTIDLVYINWIKLDFPNSFTAADDILSFEYDAPGSWNFLIDNFSDNEISVYDITNPASIVKIEGIATSPTANGFSAQFQDDILSFSEYWVGNDATQKSVQSIEADIASNLQATSNSADHIIITHKDFALAAEDLRIYRASQGYRAMLVDVQDIYDEFHYGITNAVAIRDFLEYVFGNWQSPAPSFVVLMGDGHYDPKDYLGYGRVSYIPPYLAPVDPWIVETASDNRYVTISGSDTFPDMMIGRISVNSDTEAIAAVDKIVAYERNPVSEDWQQQVLAVADNTDNAGNFSNLSDELLDCCLPDPYLPSRVYLGVTHATKDLARADIQAEINAGKLIVNYIGHAASTAWASEGLLIHSDIPLLQNGYKQPVILAMTCYDGAFHSPNPYSNNKESLGELITRVQGKGAIASWSPTGLGVATGHDYLNRGFYNAFFSQGVDTVGEATLAGKFNLWSAGVSFDLLDTYLLFGDPALMIANTYAAMDDTYQTDEDVTLNGSAPGVLSNDHGNLPFNAVWVSDPSNGSLTLNADGSFQYIPDPDFYGVDSFTYKIWNGVAYSNTATVNITVNPVNDAPVVSLIPDQTIPEGGSFAAIILDSYLSDIDNINEDMTWTYSGNSQLSVNIVDRIATINAPDPDWNGSETITFRATDPGGQYAEDAAAFTVTAVNDAPVNTVPGPQSTLMSEALIFSGATAISISDVDVPETPGALLQVTLNVSQGTLTLSQITGLLFTSGDGTSDNNLTFTGTLQDINAALDGLIYTPALGYAGSELLTIITNDQGYTGAGGSLSDTDTVTILVDELYQVYVPLIVK